MVFVPSQLVVLKLHEMIGCFQLMMMTVAILMITNAPLLTELVWTEQGLTPVAVLMATY